MVDTRQSEERSTASWRRWAAVVTAPLVLAPFALFSAWNELPAPAGSFAPRAWDALWRLEATAYLSSALCGAITWLAFRGLKPAHTALNTLGLFMGASVLVWTISEKSLLHGAIGGVMFGVLPPLAYSRIVGLRWRR